MTIDNFQVELFGLTTGWTKGNHKRKNKATIESLAAAHLNVLAALSFPFLGSLDGGPTDAEFLR